MISALRKGYLMDMTSLYLARLTLSVNRAAPRVDWDRIAAEHVRRCRALAAANAATVPPGVKSVPAGNADVAGRQPQVELGGLARSA